MKLVTHIGLSAKKKKKKKGEKNQENAFGTVPAVTIT